MNVPHGTDFHAPLLLRNAHVQTMLSSSSLRRLAQRRLRQVVNDGAQRVLLEVAAGVQLAGAFTAQRVREKSRGLAVIFHGWEGSIDSSYVVQIGARMLSEGWDVFRLNFRDHGDTHHLNTELFHSCLIDEVVAAVADIEQRYRRPGTPLTLTGFSLGGNFVLRTALAAPDAGIDLDYTVAVCPVIDPAAGLFSLETAPWMYEWYFMHKWRGSLKRKQRAFPDRRYFAPEELSQGLRGLTRSLIERHTDFGSLDNYLDGYSIARQRLAELAVPTTILTTRDDPVIPVDDFEELNLPDHVELDIAPHGGHCGFITGWRFGTFTDDYIAARLNAVADRNGA